VSFSERGKRREGDAIQRRTGECHAEAHPATAATGLLLVLAIFALGDEPFARLGQTVVGPFAFVGGGRWRIGSASPSACSLSSSRSSRRRRSSDVTRFGAMAGAIVLYSAGCLVRIRLGSPPIVRR